jgi:hypothetical protein
VPERISVATIARVQRLLTPEEREGIRRQRVVHGLSEVEHWDVMLRMSWGAGDPVWQRAVDLYRRMPAEQETDDLAAEHAQLDALEEAARNPPETLEPDDWTRDRGRPTPRDLVMQEWERIISSGEPIEENSTAQARKLAAWLTKQHPQSSPLRPDTIQRLISSSFKEQKEKRDKPTG